MTWTGGWGQQGYKPYGSDSALQTVGKQDWTSMYGNQANNLLGSWAPDISKMTMGWTNNVANSPWTQFNTSSVTPWYNQMQDRAKMVAYDAANQMSNAGVAAGRGGYGIGSGNAAAMNARSALDSVVRSQDQRYQNAAGLGYQSVNNANDEWRLKLPLMSQLWGQGLGAAANVYGAQLGAGTSLANADVADRNAWAQRNMQADMYNTGTLNDAIRNQYNQMQQVLNDQQMRTQQQRMADQQNMQARAQRTWADPGGSRIGSGGTWQQQMYNNMLRAPGGMNWWG